MPRRDRQSRLLLDLAFRDFCHERVMSACFVFSLSAVLLPLLVLFGLKFGIISNLLAPLQEDARYRQILPAGSGQFGPDWFASMSSRSDVAFIVPRTRAIAATMRVRSDESGAGRIVQVELIPSATGDPVLGDLQAPAGFDRVVLSLDTADKLGVSADSDIEGIVSRTLGGEAQTQLLPLTVTGVAPVGAFTRDGMFVSHDLLVAIEDFRDGRAVPALGWGGSADQGGRGIFPASGCTRASLTTLPVCAPGSWNRALMCARALRISSLCSHLTGISASCSGSSRSLPWPATACPSAAVSGPTSIANGAISVYCG
ncbi:MAG: hypothetical protein U5K76_09130 [Woeseiaceae bacterium]|nr:hypothetical protein [Woeseiaceae bacterium]